MITSDLKVLLDDKCYTRISVYLMDFSNSSRVYYLDSKTEVIFEYSNLGKTRDILSVK